MRTSPLKILVGGLTILLAILACGVPAGPTPTPSLPPATATPSLPVVSAPALQTLDMLDDQNGWATGPGAVYRTADGGTTWLNATPTGLASAPRASFFLDAHTAWVVESVTDPSSGTLYHTTDGGSTWSSTPVPFAGGSLDFVDASTGWVLIGLDAGMSHEAVAVFRSSDGGATWNQVFIDEPNAPGTSDSLPLVGDKNGIAAVDASHAWVTGAQPSNDFVYDYATTDGGTNWAQQNFTIPAGYSGAMTSAILPSFFGANEAVLPVQIFANTNATEFYVSHDHGQTWAATNPLGQGGFVAVGSQSDFYVWDGGTTFNASHDGGATWTTVTPNVNLLDKLMYFQFLGAQNGWALTQDTSSHVMLYRTADGGATWNVLVP